MGLGFCGLLAAWAAAIWGVGSLASRRLWEWTTPLWLVQVGRELNWGRVFFPSELTEVGWGFEPTETLPYGPFVTPTVFVLLLMPILGVFFTSARKPFVAWLRRGRAPGWDLLIIGAAFVVWCFAETEWNVFERRRMQALEECFEAVVFLGLVALEIALGFDPRYHPESREPGEASDLVNR